MRHRVRPATRVIIAGSLTGALAGMLAGCASTGPPPPDDNRPTDHIVATLGAYTANDGNGQSNPAVRIHTEDYYTGLNTRINAAPSNVMDTVSGVYADLGIPVTTRMTSTGQIGNRSYRVPGHRLKTVQLSQILDCGLGSLAGQPVECQCNHDQCDHHDQTRGRQRIRRQHLSLRHRIVLHRQRRSHAVRQHPWPGADDQRTPGEGIRRDRDQLTGSAEGRRHRQVGPQRFRSAEVDVLDLGARAG